MEVIFERVRLISVAVIEKQLFSTTCPALPSSKDSPAPVNSHHICSESQHDLLLQGPGNVCVNAELFCVKPSFKFCFASCKQFVKEVVEIIGVCFRNPRNTGDKCHMFCYIISNPMEASNVSLQSSDSGIFSQHNSYPLNEKL